MPLQRSWIDSANDPDGDFPLNNLPYGVFSRGSDSPVCCVAIGDFVLDLAILEAEGILPRAGDEAVFDLPFLNEFMETGSSHWQAVRDRLTDLLSEGGDPALARNEGILEQALVPRDSVDLHLPFVVNEYTDFYAGRHHATNVGTMFRGAENALPPNWLHIPIGYNGRASTIVVSGTEVRRPLGQLKPPGADVPHFGPSQRLDIELEMGAVVGTGNPIGQPVSVAEADDMIFGYVILNDWSARDIQAWEYQPLGPFQAKVFASTISPWVVPKPALEPFRCATPKREKPLLDYLHEPGPMLYDIELQVKITPEDGEESLLAETNYKEMYYSSAQQLCHHAIGGCEMNAGDLIGSGTISGPEKHQRGSLLEMSWGGKEPIELPDGNSRTFIEDGDTLTLTGHARGDGYRIGFGPCSGTILPAHDPRALGLMR